MLPVAGRVVEPLLSFVGIQGHLPVNLYRKCIVLDTIQGKPARAVIEGRRNRTQQPVLQDANAAHAALVEIQPVIRDPAFGITRERNTPQEFEQRALELHAIRFSFQLVAGKMDGQAPASVGVLGWISEIRQAWRTFAPPYLPHRRCVHDLKFLSWCIFSDAFQCMLTL